MDTLRILGGPSADIFLVRDSCEPVETFRTLPADSGVVGETDDMSLLLLNIAAVGVAPVISGQSGTKVFGLGVLSSKVFDREPVPSRRLEGRCGYRFDRILELKDDTDGPGAEESDVSSSTLTG